MFLKWSVQCRVRVFMDSLHHSYEVTANWHSVISIPTCFPSTPKNISFSSIISWLGPFYGAIAVPSVTRCRCHRCCCCCCCCCGHRFYIAIHQVSLLSHAACAISWLRLILVVVATVATPGEWQCKIRTGGVRRLAVANGPNVFEMLLVIIIDYD